jgi:hypothetical protein
MKHAIAAAELVQEVIGIVMTGKRRGCTAGAGLSSQKVIQEAGKITAGRCALHVWPSSALGRVRVRGCADHARASVLVPDRRWQ